MSEVERSDGKQLDVTERETQHLFDAPLPMSTEAVVAGHICLDIIPTLIGDSIALTPGRLIEAGEAIISTGGPVSNTGLALHKLGITTGLMGKVGNDLFGQAILEIVGSYGATLTGSMIVSPGEASSYSIILSHPTSDRVIIHAPGCNDTFSPDDVRYDLLEHTGLFHFGYPPLMARMYQENGVQLADTFARVKELGVTTSLDLSMPDPASPASRADWYAILAATLPYVDVFLPSVEELLLMLRRPLFEKLSVKTAKARKAGKASHMGLLEYVTPETISELGQLLIDLGARVVGLKVGPRGLYLRTATAEALEQMGRAQPTTMNLVNWADRELWAPCFETKVVGTTGAGDATIAGFLMGLLRGMTPEATLAAACAVGACNVEAADALSGIRSWPTTMERIAAGWPRLRYEKKGRSALNMTAAGWRWDRTHEVWMGPMDPRR